MKTNSLFKILTVIISSFIILGCFAACDKEPVDVDPPTNVIEIPTDEVTTEESTNEVATTEKEEVTEEKTTEEKTTEEEKFSEPVETTKKPVETTTKKPSETTTQKPATTTKPTETTTKKQDTAKYTSVNQTVYATETVNIRKEANTSSARVGSLSKGQSIKRIAIGDNGWSKVSVNGTIAYVASNYLTTTKPQVATTTKPTETTTQKQDTTKPVETTTKKPVTTTQSSGGQKTGIYATLDGKKYPVYKDSNGDYYFYDDLGLENAYHPNTSDKTEVRGDECSVCGKTTCARTMSSYYCVVCKKTIPNGTCHAASHYAKSH